MNVDVGTRARQWLGPVLMATGFLVAAFGGLTLSDCFMCTLSELLPAWGGTLIFLLGAISWQVRRPGSAVKRAGAVVIFTMLAYAAAVAARLLITGIAMGGI